MCRELDTLSQSISSYAAGFDAGALSAFDASSIVRICATDPSDRLAASVPQALRWALEKMLLLEESPDAGEPLLGNLIGWRKLTVGDRDWRIVWRHTTDESATPVIEIAEVWAVGARSDKEVYLEMADRVTSMPSTPHAVDLAEVIERFGKLRAGITPTAPPTSEKLPDWLVNQLVHTAGMQQAVVDAAPNCRVGAAAFQFLARPGGGHHDACDRVFVDRGGHHPLH